MHLRRLIGSLSTFRREAAISITFSFSYLVISAIQGPLLARSLGPELRGDLAAVYVPFLTFGWLICLGLPAAAAFYARTVPEHKILALACRFMFLIAWPVALVLGLLVPLYLSDRPHETITGLRVLLLATTLIIPAEVGESLIRVGRGAGFRYNLLRSIRPVLSLVLLVGLSLFGRLTLGSAMGAFAIGTLVGATLEILIMRLPLSLRSDREIDRKMVSFGLRSAGETGALTVVARLDQLILAASGYRAELGLYAVAATLAQLSAPLSNGVAAAMFPAMQRAGGEQEARRLVKRAAVGVTLGSIAIAGVLALVARVLLRFAFGSEFEDAAVFVWLLLPGEVAYDLGNVLSTDCSFRGRPGIGTQAMGLAAGTTVVLVPFAISRWGAEGAAAVTSMAYGLRVLYLLLRWNAPMGDGASYAPELSPDPV